MPAFSRITINGPQFFEYILKPNFGDLIKGDMFSGYHGEFTVMTDVPYEKKIIDITRLKNILRRRDASCGGEFAPLAKMGGRRIITTPIGGGVRFCNEEFYQGCLTQWRNGDPLFIKNIGKWFQEAIATDIMTLNYFGDITSPGSSDPESYNTNQYDGIYTQYKKYVAANVIKGAQTFNIPSGTISAANSIVYLENLYTKQDMLMNMLPNDDKAFYIDKAWADAYESYLIASGAGTTNANTYIQNGVKIMAYRGIPIFVNPFFNPVLNQIVGTGAHFGVLTLRGNFVFATDSKYGTGPNGDQALRVWWSEDEEVWKWRAAFKAGTQIALPEHSTLALPA